MSLVKILPPSAESPQFIPADMLPADKDEYYIRDEQQPRPASQWRGLRPDELVVLERNNNRVANWEMLLVTEEFSPERIRGCSFEGLVRIGALGMNSLDHEGLVVQEGIFNSRIVACDIGDHCAIHNVALLSHMIVGDCNILFNVDEIRTSADAVFGTGVQKAGSQRSERIQIEVVNENGGRRVTPFTGMTTADALLGALLPQDHLLKSSLSAMSQRAEDARIGVYGTLGDHCVIRSSGIVLDCRIGAYATVTAATSLQSLTIESTIDEQTHIGAGVILREGIIAGGCHVCTGAQATHFVLCAHVTLKQGVRLSHSIVGENSTLACGELQHNLLFPFHEQHHNNSFLIASLIAGQSNIAAGATLGSNHNSRASDGEIRANRGFWPGLCVSLKHSSRFASFVLLVKGDFLHELDVSLPFTLVTNDTARDRLVVVPAWWWMHNRYALMRNESKFRSRDKRATKNYALEYDALAPDTSQEIEHALRLLQQWSGHALALRDGKNLAALSVHELGELGKQWLLKERVDETELTIIGQGLERSERTVVIRSCRQAYQAYRDMLHYYGVKTLLGWMYAHPKASLEQMALQFKECRDVQWQNLGGQVVTTTDLDLLRQDIRGGSIATWKQVHQRYAEWWQHYPLQKAAHAYGVLCRTLGIQSLDQRHWHLALSRGVVLQEQNAAQVLQCRKKDYEDPFRQAIFGGLDEINEVMGRLDDNAFIKKVQEESEIFKKMASMLLKHS